jgi:hypothetical protein
MDDVVRTKIEGSVQILPNSGTLPCLVGTKEADFALSLFPATACSLS